MLRASIVFLAASLRAGFAVRLGEAEEKRQQQQQQQQQHAQEDDDDVELIEIEDHGQGCLNERSSTHSASVVAVPHERKSKSAVVVNHSGEFAQEASLIEEASEMETDEEEEADSEADSEDASEEAQAEKEKWGAWDDSDGRRRWGDFTICRRRHEITHDGRRRHEERSGVAATQDPAHMPSPPGDHGVTRDKANHMVAATAAVAPSATAGSLMVTQLVAPVIPPPNTAGAETPI